MSLTTTRSRRTRQLLLDQLEGRQLLAHGNMIATMVYGQTLGELGLTQGINKAGQVVAGSYDFGDLNTRQYHAGQYNNVHGFFTPADAQNNGDRVSVSLDLTVSKADWQVDAIDTSKIYGGAAADQLSTFAHNQGGEYVLYRNPDGSAVAADDYLPVSYEITGPSGVVSDSTLLGAGSYTVTPQVIGNEADGTPWANDVNFTYQTGTLTVGKAQLTVTVHDQSMTYGDVPPAFSYDITGVQNGDAIAVSVSPDGAKSSSGNLVAGKHNLKATVGQPASNYVITVQDGALTIGKKALTVTLDAKNKVYDGTVQAGPGTMLWYSGNVPGDQLQVKLDSASFADPNAGLNKLVTGLVSLGFADAGNYTAPATVTDTARITPAPLSYTAPDLSTVYGTVADTSGLPASIPGVHGEAIPIEGWSVNDGMNFYLIGQANIPAGSYDLQAAPSYNPNYDLVSLPGSFIVSPATLLIKATDQTMTQGHAVPNLTVYYNGFVNDETPAVLAGTLNVTTPATSSSPVGHYPITPGGLTAVNYNVVYQNGDLNVVATQAPPIKPMAGFFFPEQYPAQAGFVIDFMPVMVWSFKLKKLVPLVPVNN